MRAFSIVAPILSALFFISSALAQDNEHQHGQDQTAADQPQRFGHHPAQDEHAGHVGHETMGSDHSHHGGAGMWMFGYQYSRMSMAESMRGTETVDSGMSMNMDMHMFHVMYNATDNLSFMTMFHYMYSTMDMMPMDMAMPASTSSSMTGMDHMHMKVASRHGGATETATPTATPTAMHHGSADHLVSYGLGDTTVAAMYKVFDPLMLTFGVSLPTGPIDITMLDSNNNQYYLPYMMQLGSGTYDIKPGLVFNDNFGRVGYGIDLAYTYRIGENKRGYTLGNRIESSGWLKYQATEGVSFSTRLGYTNWDVVHRHNTSAVSLGYMDDPLEQGGQRLDAFIGIKGMTMSMLGFAFEIGAPVYQNLNYNKAIESSSQMKTTLLVNASIEYMF